MSKSLTNRSVNGNNKCGCASKSLLNGDFTTLDQSTDAFVSERVFGVSTSSANQTLTDFISTQNTNADALNPTRPAPLTDAEITDLFNRLLALGLTTAFAQGITIGGGGLVLQNNTISSNTSIVLNPSNPTPCSGEVTINDNLTVNGCYTQLCTDDTIISDPVPTIGSCTTTAVDDTSDRGFLFRYVQPVAGIQRNAFIGLDKDRYPTSGPRFVLWHDTVPDAGIDNYQRDSSDTVNMNGLEADTLYAYRIKNPDYANAPATLNSYSKNNVIIEAASSFNAISLNQFHQVGIAGGGTGTFRVEDINNTTCNYIEMTDDASRLHGGVAGAGIFLFHENGIVLNTQFCGGASDINILAGGDSTITTGGDISIIAGGDLTLTTGGTFTETFISKFYQYGVAGGGLGTFRIEDINNTTCNFIEITDDATRTHGATMGRGIYLFSEDRIELNTQFCGAGGPINILADGDIVLNASAANSLISVNPGIEFAAVGANPSTSSPASTIWYDTTLTNFKSFYTPDATDYPFVLSASENAGNQFHLSMYSDNSGYVLSQTTMSAVGPTFGLLNATGALLNQSATSAGILGATPIVNRGMFWVANTIPTTAFFTDSAGTDFPLATAGVGTLQQTYNASATPATITLTAAAKKINIRDSAVTSMPIFDIQNNGGVTTYFSVSSTQSVISTILALGDANNTAAGLNSLSVLAGGICNAAFGGNALAVVSTGNNNTGIGVNALDVLTTGSNNTAVGCDALGTIGTTSNCTGIGYQALINNTAANLTALGSQALNANTTGIQNTAVGRNALGAITTNGNCTAIGFQALFNNTAADNTACGRQALSANTSGTQNTAFGVNALGSITTNNNCTAVGYQALLNNTASNNTACGRQALTANTSGAQNTAFGRNALGSITTSGSCTAVGFNALINATGASNVAVGAGALDANTTAANNTAVGTNALGTVATNGNCTAVGFQALLNNTAANNTSIGSNALISATSGNQNTAVGRQALAGLTTNNNCTAIGFQALLNNTAGNITAIGSQALDSNTTGATNTAVGRQALAAITTTGACTAVGFQALLSNTVANNTAIGSGAMDLNTAGDQQVAIGTSALRGGSGIRNTAVGYIALRDTTTGANNTAVGRAAHFSNMSGSNNTLIGSGSMQNAMTVSNCTAVGFQTLVTNTATNNLVAIGNGALQSNTSGTQNTAVGFNSLNANGTGANNTSVGFNCLDSCSSGSDNTAVGRVSLTAITTTSGNTAVGSGTLQTSTGNNNVAIGQNALNTTTVGSLTGVGWSALENHTTGAFATAFGEQALRNNMTGTAITACGSRSLLANTGGGENAAFGSFALNSNTTGNFNTALGSRAGTDLTAATSRNTAVGQAAIGALVPSVTGSDNTCVGFNATVSAAASSGRIAIGSGAVALVNNGLYYPLTLATMAAATAVQFNAATGQMGPLVSSLRFKTNVTDLELDSSKIYDFQAKSFNYKADVNGPRQIGYIAEEMEVLYPDLVPKDLFGDPYSINYELMVVLMIEEMKKLKQRIEVLENK